MKASNELSRLHTAIARITGECDSVHSQEAFSELKKYLLYPPAVLSDPLLADNHPLKIDALRIIDAFEAVTNGMENPDAMSELEKVDGASALSDWKYLIYAISGLYSFDRRSVQTSIEAIHNDSPLSKLKPFFHSWLETYEPEDPLLKSFNDKLFKDQNLVSSALSQLQDAIENEFEDVYQDTARFLLLHLKDDYPAECRELSVWLVKNGGDAGFDTTSVFTVLTSLYGPMEGNRLIGVALIDSDPDLALFFFLKTLSHVIQDQLTDNNLVREYIILCHQLMNETENRKEELEPDIQYWQSIERLISQLSRDLKAFRTIDISYSPGSPPCEWLLLPDSLIENKNHSRAEKSRTASERRRLNKATQLELF